MIAPVLSGIQVMPNPAAIKYPTVETLSKTILTSPAWEITVTARLDNRFRVSVSRQTMRSMPPSRGGIGTKLNKASQNESPYSWETIKTDGWHCRQGKTFPYPNAAYESAYMLADRHMFAITPAAYTAARIPIVCSENGVSPHFDKSSKRPNNPQTAVVKDTNVYPSDQLDRTTPARNY